MTEETNEIAIPQITTTLEFIGRARQALLHARTLNDYRVAMEVATVATDAANRAAALMKAQGIAAEVVKAAYDAANDAAAVRIEAQAGMGQILRDMTDSGQRRSGKQPDLEKPDGRSGSRRVTTPEVLGEGPDMAYQHSSQWQKVAQIPPEIRQQYVEETKSAKGEITTMGLLRFATEQANGPREDARRDAFEEAYGQISRAIITILSYDPGRMAGFASNTKRRPKFRRQTAALAAWAATVQRIYGPESE